MARILSLVPAEPEPQLCEWFAMCLNEAATTRSHPILGEVPICTRCDDKIAAMAPVKITAL